MTDVHHFPNNILRAAKAVGVGSDEFSMVSPARWQSLLTQIMVQFTGSPDMTRLWIWEHLIGEAATMQASYGPDNILAMMGAECDVWFIAEDWCRTKRQGNFWIFEGRLGAVVQVLGDLHSFEYAVVGKKLDWIICENHHDILVASGEPALSRLRELKEIVQQ